MNIKCLRIALNLKVEWFNPKDKSVINIAMHLSEKEEEINGAINILLYVLVKFEIKAFYFIFQW